ncbi:unnamed protein product, partial [Ectocarpus fasciculatus]
SEDLKPFYTLGVNVGMRTVDQLKPLTVQHEKEAIMAGITDYFHDKISADEINELLTTHGPKLQELIGGRAQALSADVRKKGDAFMEDYLAKNPGAVKTESGLIYNETATGTGESPAETSTVTTHYHGTLIDGTVFDSSVNRGDPISFNLQQVIKGWQEGISMMKVGGKATLVVPPELAYGDEGSPPAIGGGSTLTFEVELLTVTP